MQFLLNSFLIGFLIEFFTLIMLHIWSEFLVYDYDSLLLISYYYLSDTYILTSFQFIFVTNSIKIRFEILHHNLNAIKERRMKDVDIEEAQKITVMHGKLTDAVDIVNSSFSQQVWIILLLIIYVLIFEMIFSVTSWLNFLYFCWYFRNVCSF